jgi:hypothetical protein
MSGVETPPRVTAAAEQRGLGPPVAAIRGGNPVANAVFALVMTLALFGLLLLLGALGLPFLRGVVVVLLAFSLIGLFATVITLFSGFRRYFLYTGGIVRWHNGRLQAFAWPDVTDVQRTRLGSILTGYQFTLGSGRRVQVEAIGNSDEGAAFAQLVEELLARAGIEPVG